MLLHLLNLTILVGILWFLLYSPARNILIKRHEAYETEKRALDEALEASLKEKKEAEERLAGMEKELALKKEKAGSAIRENAEAGRLAAEAEAAAIVSEAKKRAEAEKKRIVEGSQAEIYEKIYGSLEGSGLDE